MLVQAAVGGDWGRMFISVALALFVFTSIMYNYYLGESNLRFLVGNNRKVLMGYRALVLMLMLMLLLLVEMGCW